ncbi:hypothetical protein FQN49_004313 [Arthroderma sp. PD_2]|nr:hypothetical protein FQN49_004313 [Arthroderma sp. PD_2]
MMHPTTPSRSSEESFCFSAWETPRLSVAESIGRDEYPKSTSGRTPASKKANKRNKNAPHYSPRSAGSACRPQRSEHVSELVRFFKGCEIPMPDPYDFDLDSLELNGQLRQLRQRQNDFGVRDKPLSRRKKSPVKLFAPDLWSRSHATRDKQRNGHLNPATSMESLQYSPRTRSPRGSHDSNIDRPIASPKAEVDGECAYPGISVLPSSKEAPSNGIVAPEPFPSSTTMGQLYDLSSATLTGDMYGNEKMEWTDTSAGREILSGIDTDTGMPIQPMPIQPNPVRRDGNHKPQPPAKPAMPHNCAKGSVYWPQDKPLPDTPEDHEQSGQQIQIYKRDSIRVTRSTTTSSGFSKRHSISTTCESTFIDVQCLPERTSSRKARRAGRTDFSSLCCRLSCPISEDHVINYPDSFESSDKPAIIDSVDSSENLDSSAQSGSKSRGLIPVPIDSSRKYSVSSEPSPTPSSNVFSVSALSCSASSSALTSPLTWQNPSQKPEDIGHPRHDASKSMPSSPPPTVSKGATGNSSCTSDSPKSPTSSAPEISIEKKRNPDAVPKVLPAHFPPVPVRNASRLDNIHALRMRDVAAARAALKASNKGLAVPQNIDTVRARQASSPAIINCHSSSHGSSRSSEESVSSPTSFTTPTIQSTLSKDTVEGSNCDHAAKSSVGGSPLRTIMPDGSVFTDRAMRERSFRHKHNAFSILAGGSLPSSPRHSQSFPAPAPQRPSLMSPRSVAGLRALESVSRPVSPSLPSSDDEGMGTRAHSGKSRRSTRSSHHRNRQNSILTNDKNTKARNFSHDEPLPLTPPSANATRPNDPDSLLSPYTPTSFKYYFPTSESSLATQSHQQQFLQDRVFYLERQNKMLQSALLSALEVGAKCDAQRERNRTSTVDGVSDDIIDMLNLYRTSYDSGCGLATASAAAIRSETRRSTIAPSFGDSEISCSSTTTSRLSVQGRFLARPSTSPSTAKERARRRLIEPYSRVGEVLPLR